MVHMPIAGPAEGETTRARLISAAVDSFTSVGYDGVSVREIERRAGVNSGLVAYHFGSKEELWKEAVGWLMARFHDEFERYRPVLADLSASERQRVLFTVYGRFSARYPAYFRLLMLEGDQETKRSRWLVDEQIRPFMEFFRRVGEHPSLSDATEVDAVAHFLFISAAAGLFAMPALSRLLYGVDPENEGTTERAVQAVARLGMAADRLAAPPPTSGDAVGPSEHGSAHDDPLHLT